MTFKKLNLGNGLQTIEYVEQKATNTCDGCFARHNADLCFALPDSCLKDGVVFLRRFVEVTDCV